MDGQYEYNNLQNALSFMSFTIVEPRQLKLAASCEGGKISPCGRNDRKIEMT
jgi:hypothetical protein